MNKKLQDLIEESIAAEGGTIDFVYDSGTWCLCGVTRDGLVWETDDFEADSLEQAEADAIYYLESY